MADPPQQIDSVTVDVTGTVDIEIYSRGIIGLYVLGFITFGDGTYWEPPQFINFPKMRLHPKDKRATHMKYQFKPGLVASVKPRYYTGENLTITTDSGEINFQKGLFDGLRAIGASGVLGPLAKIEAASFE